MGNRKVNRLNKGTVVPGAVLSNTPEHHVAALIQISTSTLTLTQNVDSLLQLIAEKTRELLKCDLSYITVLNEQQKELRVKASSGLHLPEMRASSISADEGLAGWVRLNEESAVCTDYATDPRHNSKSVDLLQKEGIVSILAVPLKFSGKVRGVLFACNRTARQFAPQHVQLCSAFANMASIGLQNALLYSQQRRTLNNLKRAGEIHNEFINTALKAGGTVNIASNLVRLINLPVVVENIYGEILANLSPVEQNDQQHFQDKSTKSIVMLAKNNISVKNQLDVLANIQNHKRRAIIRVPSGNGFNRRLTAPIVANRKILGYLSVIIGHGRTLSPLDKGAIDYAGLVLALEMTKIQSVFEAEQRSLGDFLSSLLFGQLGTKDQLLIRAAYLGYDLNGPHSIIIARPDTSDLYESEKRYDFQADILDRLLHFIVPAVSTISPGSIATALNNDIIVFAVEKSGDKNSLGSTTNKIISLLLEAPKSISSDLAMRVGIGCLCERPEEYKKSYEQARKALELAKFIGKQEAVVDLEKLGIYGILFEPDNLDRLLKFSIEMLAPLIDHDHKYNTKLLETLETYYLLNSSRKSTAIALFVHENTMAYRLKQIEQLCKLDLSNQDAKVALQIALKLHKFGHVI